MPGKNMTWEQIDRCWQIWVFLELKRNLYITAGIIPFQALGILQASSSQ